MSSPKPVLALLHGWGMNGRVFDRLVQALAPDFDVRTLELPGHGSAPLLASNTLRAWAEAVAEQIPPDAVLLGWSLGGQVAMRIALDFPGTVRRLVLLGSTPRFVADETWAHGMRQEDLATFGAALLAEPEATLLRFLSLQTRGMADQKTVLQQLRQSLRAAPPVQGEALAAGLALLRDTDLRAEVSQIKQPTLVLHGELDTLTPTGAGAWLGATVPQARYVAFSRAAHAPHLSHTNEVADAIRGFLHE